MRSAAYWIQCPVCRKSSCSGYLATLSGPRSSSHLRYGSPIAKQSGTSMVELALTRPYTFIVMAMLIVLATPFALLNMATDIFPEINIPVISIIWNYNGLSAQEMGQRIAAQTERGLTTTVSDIEHIESHVARRHHGHQGLLPADGQHPDGDRAGGRVGADAGAPAAARHHAAARHQVLGLEHPGGPARPVQPDAARAVAVRRRGQHAAPAAHHDSRRRDPVPVRRQEPADLRRPRHAGAAGARPVAGRRGQRGQHAEPDPALGHREVRRRPSTRCR